MRITVKTVTVAFLGWLAVACVFSSPILLATLGWKVFASRGWGSYNDFNVGLFIGLTIGVAVDVAAGFVCAAILKAKAVPRFFDPARHKPAQPKQITASDWR